MLFKGISFGSLLLVFLIILVLFGTKRLREIGNDLGAAVKNFRKGVQEEDVVEKEK
jgi:sec-independent protein translocase protein TatA